MLLELTRTYYPKGTNGTLSFEGRSLCRTIELPWKDNLAGISCIPEGRYALVKRYSARLQWHLWIREVPGRELILIHPANDALRQLRGCIAPVAIVTSPGRGFQSRIAFNRLAALLFPALERAQEVLLVIKSAGSAAAKASPAAGLLFT